MSQRPRWVTQVAGWGGVALLAFLVTVVGVVRHSPLIRLDGAVRDFTTLHRTTTGFAIFSLITWFGTFSVMGPALLVGGAVLSWVRRSLAPLVVCASAVLLLGSTVSLGKLVIDRRRPPISPGLALAEDGSFPSGHTTTSVVLGFVLLLLLDERLSRRGRRVGLALLVLFTALIGTSRVYLGAHWFTDVLGGWLLGSAITAVLAVGWWVWQPETRSRAEGRAPRSRAPAVAASDPDPVLPRGRAPHAPSGAPTGRRLRDRFGTTPAGEGPRDPRAEGAPS